MYTVIKYKIDNDNYTMIVIDRGLSRSLIGGITDGDLFKNGKHHKAYLWQDSPGYKEIRSMIINNIQSRNIKIDSAYEYSGMPWDEKYNLRHPDIDIARAFRLNTFVYL